MEIREVKRQIKCKQLGKFYIFTGEEIEAQRIYIDKMAEVTGRTVTRADSVADVLRYKQGIVKVPRLFVVIDDKDFMKADNAWGNVDDLLGDKLLILQLSTVDKRMKFFKHFENEIVTFNYMSTDVLFKYVQRACKLDNANTEQLINMCGNDYSRILLEIDKIEQYCKGTGALPNEAFSNLVEDGTIYKIPEDAIFDFVEAVLQAKPQRAYRLLEDCRAYEEPSLVLLSVMYKSIKQVLQVQVCTSKDVCASTGLTSWEVKRARQNTGYWKSEDLVYFLRLIQAIEKAIKTGAIEESIAVDYVLTRVF